MEKQSKQIGLYAANLDSQAAGAPEGTGIETEARSATKPPSGAHDCVCSSLTRTAGDAQQNRQAGNKSKSCR